MTPARTPETRPSSRRRAIVELLTAATEPVAIADLAERLGVHPNTIRFHLEALERDGLVERVDGVADGPGRPAAAYRAVARMDPSGPREYEMLAGVLASALSGLPDTETTAVRAGFAWGGQAVSSMPGAESGRTAPSDVDLLVDLLDGIGFEPRTRGRVPTAIELRHCPFLEIAGEHQDVVCAIHLGLMQGALDATGSTTSVESLEPFAQPDRCIATLSRTSRE